MIKKRGKGVVITFVDITESKINQEKIAKTEERFKLVVEGARDGVWDWFDVNKDEEWWSPQFYRLVGYTPEELPASLENFGSMLHPDDTSKTFAAVEAHFKDDNCPFDITYRLNTKEEGYKWFRAKATLTRDEEGKPVRMVGSISDVHEEVLNKEKLLDKTRINEAIMEGTMAGYWDWMIQEKYEYMSDSFKAMFGYTPDEVPNTPEWWMANIHQDDLPGVLKCFDNHVSTRGEVPFDNKVRYYHKDGSIVWIYCRGKVIEWDEEGKPVRMVGSHVDVTPLARVEESLTRKKQELEKTNLELEQFAYVATHDLRAPAINLEALIKMFKDEGYVNENNDPVFKRIESSIGQLNETLHDLIGIANIKKSPEENIALLSIKDIFDEVSESINVQYNCSPKIEMDIQEDSINYLKGHLKSIIYNLYSNAVKYRNLKENCEITFSTSKDNEGRIRFELKDNGIGFSMDKLDKVFGLFQRLTTQAEGKGLGLYTVKSLIESQNGSIDVNSKEGQGTTFSFVLEDKVRNKQEVVE